ADDFLRRIALDPLGALVPRRDVSARIQHEDRVVLHALDHAPEPLLALAQLLLRLALLRQVARHAAEADQLARLAPQRGDDHVRPETRAVTAHPPRLFLHAPVAHRLAQRALRLPRRNVLRRIEDGEVAADRL